jgi:hypothetical protein
MQIKSLVSDALSSSKKASSTPSIGQSVNINYSEEVQPVIIRKTPKFPSRERHLAIRRRKPSSPESQKSECLDMSIDDSDESISGEE